MQMAQALNNQEAAICIPVIGGDYVLRLSLLGHVVRLRSKSKADGILRTR